MVFVQQLDPLAREVQVPTDPATLHRRQEEEPVGWVHALLQQTPSAHAKLVQSLLTVQAVPLGRRDTVIEPVIVALRGASPLAPR